MNSATKINKKQSINEKTQVCLYRAKAKLRDNPKSEKSQDYAQKPQRNCTFMNSISVDNIPVSCTLLFWPLYLSAAAISFITSCFFSSNVPSSKFLPGQRFLYIFGLRGRGGQVVKVFHICMSYVILLRFELSTIGRDREYFMLYR